MVDEVVVESGGRKAESGWVHSVRFTATADFFDFDRLIDATTIRISSSASNLSADSFSFGKTPLSSSNSSHNAVSSSSCSTIPSLETNSADERALDASRKLAATDVPDRRTCFPSVWAKVAPGREV